MHGSAAMMAVSMTPARVSGLRGCEVPKSSLDTGLGRSEGSASPDRSQSRVSQPNGVPTDESLWQQSLKRHGLQTRLSRPVPLLHVKEPEHNVVLALHGISLAAVVLLVPADAVDDDPVVGPLVLQFSPIERVSKNVVLHIG